jgi:hypothetical protein
MSFINPLRNNKKQNDFSGAPIEIETIVYRKGVPVLSVDTLLESSEIEQEWDEIHIEIRCVSTYGKELGFLRLRKVREENTSGGNFEQHILNTLLPKVLSGQKIEVSEILSNQDIIKNLLNNNNNNRGFLMKGLSEETKRNRRIYSLSVFDSQGQRILYINKTNYYKNFPNWLNSKNIPWKTINVYDFKEKKFLFQIKNPKRQ